jgi:hypothetical protein
MQTLPVVVVGFTYELEFLKNHSIGASPLEHSFLNTTTSRELQVEYMLYPI